MRGMTRHSTIGRSFDLATIGNPARPDVANAQATVIPWCWTQDRLPPTEAAAKAVRRTDEIFANHEIKA
jgi:hypothetical protein